MSRVTHADPGPGACAVTTHALSKRFGGETALDCVDLRVPEGLETKATIGGAGFVGRPIWYYLIASAWFLAAFEWFLYNRRWIS